LSVVLTISFIGVAKSQATTARKDREVGNENIQLGKGDSHSGSIVSSRQPAFVVEGGRLGILAWGTA
jgi:hypothetical protein